MASDAGIVKVGISVDPVFRLIDVCRRWPVIRRIHAGYGMSGHDAASVERAVHRKLQAVRHEKELFKCSTDEAMAAIEQVMKLFGIAPVPFVVPATTTRKMRKPRVLKSPAKETQVVAVRLDRDLKERIEQRAADDRRTVSSWVAAALVSALGPAPVRARKAREPVTAGSHR